MRSLPLSICAALALVASGCSKDTLVNHDSSREAQEIATGAGYGQVLGYEGYFSPELSPRGYAPLYPPGYVMTDFVWEEGAPDGLYMIYLQGRESDLAKAHRVRVRGNWTCVTRTVDTAVGHYIKLSVSSLEILE